MGEKNPSRNEKTRENLFLQTTAAFSALLISINAALRKSAGTTVRAPRTRHATPRTHTRTHRRHATDTHADTRTAISLSACVILSEDVFSFS